MVSVQTLVRTLTVGTVAGGLALFALTSLSPPARGAGSSFVQNGRAGFVVSDIGYILARDSSQTGACPNGRSIGYREIFRSTPDGARHEGESDADFARRIDRGSLLFSNASTGTTACVDPTHALADTHFRTVTGRNVAIDGGIDLDGQVSRVGGHAAPGTCAHDDFRTVSGDRGVDNQFFRAVGCINSFQPGGNTIPWATEMLTGAWGILITLDGVDDLQNDNDVTVGIDANNDPIQLSPTRAPVPFATYSVHQNARYRATTHGRIVNGVLTTDPVNVRFLKITNNIRMERPLDDARIRATISADGTVNGVLAGYTQVDDMYNFQFGFREAFDRTGHLSRGNFGSSVGAANNLGYSCQGAYNALRLLADGHRDPATGRCSAISTQYHFRAIPAFVVDAATQSVNQSLDNPQERTP